MKRHSRTLKVLLLPVLGLSLLSLAAAPRLGEPVELDEAEVFIEFNATDGDFGIQFFWDADAWSSMKVTGPTGTALNVKAAKNLKLQGLAEGFFESDEPPVSELPMSEFLARFPEGTYLFKGKGIEGETLEGEADFTHTLPAAPTNLFPAEGAVVDSTMPLVASFDPVTMDLGGNPLVPDRYEVVVEMEHPDLGEITCTIVLEGDLLNPQMTVPPEFLEPGTEYKLEVIVQEDSGNRTISETTWTTLP